MKDLTSDQKWLLKKVAQESRKRADETLRQAKLSSEQEVHLHAAKDILERSSLVLNIDLRESYKNRTIIDNVLAVGRIFNRFEIGKAATDIHDYYFRMRYLSEFKLYGATSDLQPILAARALDQQRPNYAAIDYLGQSASLAGLRSYGFYRFVLKPREALRQRATFTPRDSFWAEREEVHVWDDVEGLLATKPKPGGHFWFEYVLNKSEPDEFRKGRYYIEAQILGGLYLSEDIEALYYPPSDLFDPDFSGKLKRFEVDHGIKLMHYE